MTPSRLALSAALAGLLALTGCATETHKPAASATNAAEHAGHHPEGAPAPEPAKPDQKMGGDRKGGMMGSGMMSGGKSGKMGGDMMAPKGQAETDKDKMAMKCDQAMKDAKGDCPMMKK